MDFRRLPYHIEASPLICLGNHWTGFYMIGTSVMKVQFYKFPVTYSWLPEIVITINAYAFGRYFNMIQV